MFFARMAINAASAGMKECASRPERTCGEGALCTGATRGSGRNSAGAVMGRGNAGEEMALVSSLVAGAARVERAGGGFPAAGFSIPADLLTLKPREFIARVLTIKQHRPMLEMIINRSIDFEAAKSNPMPSAERRF